jgi:hypothetical protein
MVKHPRGAAWSHSGATPDKRISDLEAEGR